MSKKTKKVYDIIPPSKGGSRLVDLGSEKTKKISKKKKLFFRNWIFLFLIILIGAGLFLYFYLPRAEVIVWPKTDTLNFEKNVIVDAELKEENINPSNSEETVIPGEVFEASREEEKNFSATGETTQEGKAKGVIRVYNNYQQAQVLVKNTRFQPPLDKVIYFRTTERVVVPVKSYVDIEVVADQSGPDYNIEASTFSIPGLAGLPQYYSIYGKSFSPMTGGFVGEVKTITKEDIDKAEKETTAQAFSELKKYLLERVPAGFVLLEETFEEEILESSCLAKAGDAADSFSCKTKAKLKVLLYKEEYLKQMATVFFQANKSPNKEIQITSLKIELELDQIDWEKGKAALKFKASVKIYSPFNAEDLKQRLIGKNINETRSFLENWTPVEKIEVKFWPLWTKKIPKNTNRLNIVVKLAP